MKGVAYRRIASLLLLTVVGSARSTWSSSRFLIVEGTGFTSNGRIARNTQHASTQRRSSLVPEKILAGLLRVRGGDSKRRTKSRTASLSSTRSSSRGSNSKTSTGKKKVGASTDAVVADKKSGALSDTVNKYKRILPMTRLYITLIGISTLLGLILGEELTQALLALDPGRVVHGMELWRPLTAATFLGPPSIGWLMSGYYLFEYGSTLERAYGTAQQLVFLLSQIGLLSVFSALTGQPFFAQSMITSMLHVISRSMPHQKVKWLVFTVPYWSLPYGLMATDVLQAQSAMAALPHILGILSGHFYQFHKFIWPKIGGEDWLTPPAFLQRKLDPNYKSSDEGRITSSASRSRNKKKGRKLGS
jgi:membrane associated rhomboid family serine protease